MTGNTKVWRAPLAGLASLAMLATMGLAVGTANAATDGASVTFKVGDDKVATYTEQDLQAKLTATEQSKIDGKIDKAELYAALFDLAVTGKSGQFVVPDDSTFTGWADGSTLEVVTDGVNEFADPAGLSGSNVTLTARYSKDPFTVNFNNGATTNGGVSQTSASGKVLLSADDSSNLDLIPAWAVPTEDATVGDGYVAYHKDGKTLAKNAYWTAKDGGKHVDPTASGLFEAAFAGDSHETTLTLTPAKAVKVSFLSQAAVQGTGPFDVYVNGAAVSTPFSLDVATVETINDFTDFPVAKKQGNGNLSTNVWYAGGQVQSADQLGVKYTASTTVSSAGDVELRAGVPTQQKQVTLHYQDKADTKDYALVPSNQAYKPADLANITTSSVEYKFAGWYTAGGEEYVAGDTNVPSDLYAHWDIAAVKFTVNPNYGQAASKSFWVSNGKNFKLPVASDYRAGWNATLDPVSLWADGKSVNNFNMYMLNNSADKDAKGVTSSVLLKYADKTNSTDVKYIIRILSGSGAYLEPGQVFTFTNWTKGTYAERVKLLREMEKYVTITKKDGSGYIEGKDQTAFTAASFDQYVSDYQDYDTAKMPEGSLDDVNAKIDALAAIQAKLVETSPSLLYRAYNPNTGDHYYTTDKVGYDALVKLGWRAEGTPYAVIAKDNGREYVFGTAIYSAYNPNTGEHLLTVKSEAEDLANYGWKNEGVAFYAPQGATESVYRLYNPNTNGPAHVYTGTDEYNGLLKAGWSGEDLVFKLNSGK